MTDIQDKSGTSVLGRYEPFLTKTEKIKETIYGLVTLLATMIGLWLHRTDSSAGEALTLVFGTTAGLWLACFFADILAQSITVREKEARKHAKKHAFDASLGIWIAGRMPILLMGLAYLGWINFYGAILASIVMVVWQLMAFSVFSLYRLQNSLWENLIILAIQGVILLVVIWLKLGH